MAKIYTIGETVLDIIFDERAEVQSKPGGSMLNTAVSLGRLGLPIYHISLISNDKASDLLIDFLNENNVNTQFIKRTHQVKTNLALAFLDEEKKASYSFYKDTVPEGIELVFPNCTKGDVVLFGSFFSLNEVFHAQLSTFLQKAKSQGAFVIYDPNFRTPFINQLSRLKPLIERNIANANLVKASNEDFINVFNVQNEIHAWDKIKKFNLSGLVYTMGEGGSCFINNNFIEKGKAQSIEPKSTIGAGDTFSAGIIYFLFKNFISGGLNLDLTNSDWKACLQIASEFAAQTCMSYDNYISTDFVNKITNV